MVKPGLGRIHFLVDEDGCKGSWGNIGVMYVFIYVVKKTCQTALIRSLENG